MKTTAQFRSEAFDAEQALSWSLAAKLYQSALDVYPAQNAKSELAIADIEGLKKRIKSCRGVAGIASGSVTVFPKAIAIMFGYVGIEWYDDFVKVIYSDGKKLIDTLANGEKLLAEYRGLI